eukprot:1328090-Pyramimonas_sp.AAC.1
MVPDVPKKNHRHPRSTMRLYMMIATHLLDKFAKMKRSQRLSVQHANFLSQINRVEHSCQIEGQFLTGRE